MMRTYQALKRITFGMPITIAIGLVMGGLLSPVVIATNDWLATQYDRVFPVVEMSGTLMSHSNGEAVIALGGRKNRECGYMRIQAYSQGSDGHMHDAFITRTDTPENGETKPVGVFQLGTWRVWPLPDSKGIAVYLNHMCGSRLVITQIADIPLKAAEPSTRKETR